KTRSLRPPGPANGRLDRRHPMFGSTLQAPMHFAIVRFFRSRMRSAISRATTRAVRLAHRLHDRWPPALRRALPLDLIAGIGAGLLLTLVFVLAIRRIPLKLVEPIAPARSTQLDVADAPPSWSAQPLLLQTAEARTLDAPGTATSASGRTVLPRAPVHRKR